MATPPFGLAPGVHVARIGERFVVLDRGRDGYSLLTGEVARALDRLFRSGAISAALDPLVAAGVLQPGVRRLPQPIAPPVREIIAGARPAGWSDRLRAWLACLSTATRLRLQSLDRVCTSLEPPARLRRRCELGAALSAFAAARRWYPKTPICLFDSLALQRFLLAQGIAARTVFGVRLDPFAAHSWVEVEDAVVNDRLATVRGFTPIMVVGS